MAYVTEKLSAKRGMKTLELAQYPHIPDSDLFRVKRCLPPCAVGGPWIAGGSVWRTVNKEPLNNCDIDVFFRNRDQFEQTCRQMNSIPFVRNILKETKNKWNTTYRVHVNQGKYDKTIDVQFINMSFYSKLENLLDSFDFTVCQFGYNGENIIMNDTSLEDLEGRRLVLWKATHPKTMLKHMIKYMGNGFTISSDETKRLTNRILDMDCWSKSASKDYNEKADKNPCAEVPFDAEPDWGEEEPDVGGQRQHRHWGRTTLYADPPTANTGFGYIPAGQWTTHVAYTQPTTYVTIGGPTTAVNPTPAGEAVTPAIPPPADLRPPWTPGAEAEARITEVPPPNRPLTVTEQATQNAREAFDAFFGNTGQGPAQTPAMPALPTENPFAQPAQPTPEPERRAVEHEADTGDWEGFRYTPRVTEQGNNERR